MNREIADDIVKELINLGADDTLADSHKETAYHFAARYSPDKLQVSLCLSYLLGVLCSLNLLSLSIKKGICCFIVFSVRKNPIKPHSTLYIQYGAKIYPDSEIVRHVTCYSYY